MTEAHKSLMFEVTSDFLIPGDLEPLALAPEGPEAMDAAASLSVSIGELERGLDEVLELSYLLKGPRDCPMAAKAVLDALARCDLVREAMGTSDDDSTRSNLERRRRRRVRKKQAEWKGAQDVQRVSQLVAPRGRR